MMKVSYKKLVEIVTDDETDMEGSKVHERGSDDVGKGSAFCCGNQ